MNDREQTIIVTMTSWRGRIDNVRPVVERLLCGTMIPDRIICNLSSEEFPLREAELPASLSGFAAEEPRFEIWWVEENTYAFKKLIPTLERFPEAVVITVDDDFWYDRRFVEKLYASYLAEGRTRPITCRRRFYDGIYFACGAGSLYTRKFFGDKLLLLDKEIVAVREDDWFYTCAMLLNGVLFAPARGLDVKLFRPFNPILPSKDRLYDTAGTTDFFNRKVESLTGMDIAALGSKVKCEKYGFTESDLRDEECRMKRMRWLRRLKQLFTLRTPKYSHDR